MSEIIYMGVVLPGFLIVSILRLLLRRFAKGADVFDRTLYSLFFNIPVFLMALRILNYNWVVSLVSNVDQDYVGITKIDDIRDLFSSSDVRSIITLVIVTVISTIIVATLAWLLIVGVGKLADFRRGYQINHFQTVYESCFVDTRDVIPAKICDLKTGETITEGFISEVSLDEEIEFLLVERNTYKYCADQDWISDPKSIYINTSKGIKIEIYNINDIISLAKKEDTDERGKNKDKQKDRRAEIC